MNMARAQGRLPRRSKIHAARVLGHPYLWSSLSERAGGQDRGGKHYSLLRGGVPCATREGQRCRVARKDNSSSSLGYQSHAQLLSELRISLQRICRLSRQTPQPRFEKTTCIISLLRSIDKICSPVIASGSRGLCGYQPAGYAAIQTQSQPIRRA